MAADISKEVGEIVKFKIAPVDDTDTARDVTAINWTNTGVGILTVADDKLSAEGTSDEVGDLTVTVTANPDLTGVGTNLLTDTGVAHFTAKPIPDATKLNLTAE